MAVSAPKKPKSASAPSAPKKPTSKSKTGNSACSQAASNWQLAIRGKATIEPDTYKTLAKCRGMLRTSKAADGRAAAGYNLSNQGAAAIKARLQSRFDRDLVSDKSREAKVKELLAGRAAKQAAAVVKPVAAPAPTTFQPKTVHVFDTYQHGSGEMKRGYVAKITGTHPKYNLERQFLNGPYERGTKTVTIKERGIYEMQSKDLNKPGSTERTYELHGRNKVRTIHESLNPRTHHVPIEDNKSIGRVARLLTLFGKKKAAAPAPPQAAPMAKPAAAVATKSAGQAQDDRLRRLGAGTDVEVKRKRDWRQSLVASARNSLIHSREDRASLQQSRDAINYTTRDRELPWMVDGVPITGDPNYRPQIKAPIARYTAARKEKAGQLVKERSERTISKTDRKRAMSIAKRVTKAPSRKQSAPAPTTFQPKTVHVFDTYQHGSGEMKRGYVAKITGTHPKYNLERQFLNGPYERGTKTVTIKERGIYEMQSKVNKPGSTEKTYELHGRNKVRTIHESLNSRTHHVPIEDNKSIGRVARLLTLFGKKKAAANKA